MRNSTSLLKKVEISNQDIEIKVLEIYKEVLGVKDVALEDNFFNLGGSSLLTMRLLTSIQKIFNLNLDLRSIFEFQTVQTLSQHIQSELATPQIENELSLPPVEPLSSKTKEGLFPLSYQQLSYWNGVVKNDENSHIMLVNNLTGPLDVNLFKFALDTVISRHGALRTKFVEKDGVPFQMLSPPETNYFIQKDFRQVNPDEIGDLIQNDILENIGEKIDLAKSPSLRCYLTRVYDEQYFLTLKIDHIVSDGPTLDILRNEIKEIYTATIEKRQALLPEIALQYVDFAAWETGAFSKSKGLEERVSFWQNLTKALPIFQLPTDYPRDSKLPVSKEGLGSVTRVLDQDLVENLKNLSKKENVTLYVTVLSTLGLLLQQLSGKNEVVFNSTISQRPPGLENMMGYFMTFMPTRINFSSGQKTSELLKQVRNTSVNTLAHLVPTVKIRDMLKSASDKEALNQVNVLFNYTEDYINTLNLPGIESEWVEIESSGGQLGEFFLQFMVAKEQTSFILLCDKSLFSDKTIESMADLFEKILNEVVTVK